MRMLAAATRLGTLETIRLLEVAVPVEVGRPLVTEETAPHRARTCGGRGWSRVGDPNAILYSDRLVQLWLWPDRLAGYVD